MSIAKTISAFALAASLVSAGLLLSSTGSALAKRSSPNGASLQREARHDQDSDSKKDRDRHRDHDHKTKDREGKHKGKEKDKDGRHADKKCGGRKKCPTPVVEPARDPGGGTVRPPVTAAGSGKGLGDASAGAGNASDGAALGD